MKKSLIIINESYRKFINNVIKKNLLILYYSYDHSNKFRKRMRIQLSNTTIKMKEQK